MAQTREQHIEMARQILEDARPTESRGVRWLRRRAVFIVSTLLIANLLLVAHVASQAAAIIARQDTNTARILGVDNSCAKLATWSK